MAYCGHLTIEKRVLLFAEYMLENKATVRQTAKRFGYSKSTVHKDVTVRLGEINGSLHGQIALLLKENLEERHIRGGKATKQKYTEIRQNGRK